MRRSLPSPVRPSLRLGDNGQDFYSANLVALICAALLLAAFIFMPWFGRELAANGARLLSDHLYGTPGAPPVPFLWLVPLTALGALGLALWGVWVPQRARITSRLILALGLIGLAYYGLALLPTPAQFSLGVGLWLALACTLGLVLQAALGRPELHAAIQRLNVRWPPVPRHLVPYLFVLPALGLYAVWIVGPTLFTFYMSLTHWDALSPARLAGLENYRRLFFHDRAFAEALGNNLRWLAVFFTIPTTLGLGLALALSGRRPQAGVRRLAASAFYTPLALSLPVIGLIWSWLYNPRLGLINGLLFKLGLADPPGWLGDRELAIWCVIAAAVWRQAGYVMVLYAAGLRGIDTRVVEAARVDGAAGWPLLRHVLLPLLWPATTIVLIVATIDSLRSFDLIAIMTRGGQGTQVLAHLMYMEAFNNYRMGYAAAIGVVLFTISLGMVGLVAWSARPRDGA
jgi:ABC-type sugar transport system permease subunit